MQNVPPDVPAEAESFIREMGYLDPERVAPGDPAPDGSLTTLAGVDTTLHKLRAERALVLIFGSYT